MSALSQDILQQEHQAAGSICQASLLASCREDNQADQIMNLYISLILSKWPGGRYDNELMLKCTYFLKKKKSLHKEKRILTESLKQRK